jgi:hypothetical protein
MYGVCVLHVTGLVQRTINVDVGAGSHMTEVMFVDTSDTVSSQRQVVLGSQSVNAVVVALTNAGDTYRIPLQATEPVCHISKGYVAVRSASPSRLYGDFNRNILE